MTTGRWGSYAPKSDRFVDKKDWAERRVPFNILKVDVEEPKSQGGSNFDAQWVLTVEALDGSPQTTLSFGQGAGGRDDALESAQSDLLSGAVEKIGPIMIVRVRTKRGNPFYALEEADDERGFELPQDDTGPTPRPIDRDDPLDDLPF